MATVRRFRITINGKVFEVAAEEINSTTSPEAADSSPSAASRPAVVTPSAPAPVAAERLVASTPAATARSIPGTLEIDAPLPGLVLDVKVTPGQVVSEGQVLVILEAMKMENEITAPAAGTVSAVHVEKGGSVSPGDVLVVLS